MYHCIALLVMYRIYSEKNYTYLYYYFIIYTINYIYFFINYIILLFILLIIFIYTIAVYSIDETDLKFLYEGTCVSVRLT